MAHASIKSRQKEGGSLTWTAQQLGKYLFSNDRCLLLLAVSVRIAQHPAVRERRSAVIIPSQRDESQLALHSDSTLNFHGGVGGSPCNESCKKHAHLSWRVPDELADALWQGSPWRKLLHRCAQLIVIKK